MRKKNILSTEPIPPKKEQGSRKDPYKKRSFALKEQITAQLHDGYLILDIWQQGQLEKRHAMDIETGEYGTYYEKDGVWTTECLNRTELKENATWDHIDEDDYIISREDKTVIREAAPATGKWWVAQSAGCLAGVLEQEYDFSKEAREKKAESKERRLRELMDSVPRCGTNIYKWIEQDILGDAQYALYQKPSKKFHCTACQKDFTEPQNVKMRHKDKISCPECGHALTVIKRTKGVTVKTRVTVIHNLDEKRGIERHFDVEVSWDEKRTLYMEETIRIMFMRNDKRYNCKIYYADYYGEWSEGNRCNRRWKTAHLYPSRQDIHDGLKDTSYEAWTEVMVLMTQGGIQADYNALLAMGNPKFITMCEYLLKGGFYRLLRETSEAIHYIWGYSINNALNYLGDSIEEVMQLEDRQKINRLRQENGGYNMLVWLQWADVTGGKISTEALNWYEAAGIDANKYDSSRASKNMTPEQLKNYLIRQKNESYPKFKFKTILEQLEDYLSMAEQLGKHMDDEMIFRPRQLKRRHDEAVEEYNQRREEMRRKQDAEAAEREAQRMREKYPGYEDLLKEIQEKYEYQDENYCIKVPETFGEIVAEGMALHHCVANTERYFDRIVSRETYICFLRKIGEEDKPYYTIEVEPGGTIRQHRGYLDEEPEIEEIKPFLRKWQSEIRKRMSKADHEYAQKSVELRQKNIEELTAKNNTRVLNGLIEDLMEVI